jgi:hypothetical protein
MSAIGTKRTFQPSLRMSAFGGKADIGPPTLRAFLRYNLFMWGRVILGAVIVVLVATWLAAIWIMLTDPQGFFKVGDGKLLMRRLL